jgi:hypothetical protein
MGLDISHDAWHGAYSAFHRWRSKIAEVNGIPLELMDGFYYKHYTIKSILEHQTLGYGTETLLHIDSLLPIYWDILKPDVLHILLIHSDCDGTIEVEHLEGIANRLEETLPLLPEQDDNGHIGNWREKTQKFIDGCRLALSQNEPLRFE